MEISGRKRFQKKLKYLKNCTLLLRGSQQAVGSDTGAGALGLLGGGGLLWNVGGGASELVGGGAFLMGGIHKSRWIAKTLVPPAEWGVGGVKQSASFSQQPFGQLPCPPPFLHNKPMPGTAKQGKGSLPGDGFGQTYVGPTTQGGEGRRANDQMTKGATTKQRFPSAWVRPFPPFRPASARRRSHGEMLRP